jgi:hypothetical protein
VGAYLPMAAIRDRFAARPRNHLALEFVSTDDVMFRKLIEFRVNLFSHVTLDHDLSVFSEKPALVRTEKIQNSPCMLLLFDKRG